MDDLLKEVADWGILRFREYLLEDLEAFEDHYYDWKMKSGFPFLNLTSKEYYLQKFFEGKLESYIRYFLINKVMSKLLLYAQHEFVFLEPTHDGFAPNYWNNRECETHIGFEFIEKCGSYNIGYRYVPLPSGRDQVEPLLLKMEEHSISEVIILDWSLSNQPIQPKYPLSLLYGDLSVTYWSIKDFFVKHLNENIYGEYIQLLKDTVLEFQEYIGVVSIPRLTPPLLFRFRFEVENNLLEYLSNIKKLRSCWKDPPREFKNRYGYRFIDPSKNDNHYYHNLEARSFALLFNTSVIKNYESNNYYRALIGKSGFAKCLITSEYLYKNYGGSDQFDFTAIISGYLKSVEQLMYKIALFSIDKKDKNGHYYKIAPASGKKEKTIDFTSENLEKGLIDTTLGSLCHFFNNNDVLNINGSYKKTFINCCFCFSEECRNDSFHKHNIDQWSVVETIRENTFFMYIILLGCCKLGNYRQEMLEKLNVATEDRLSRLYYQLTIHDELDYYLRFNNEEDEIEVQRPSKKTYLSFDEYGILTTKIIKLITKVNGKGTGTIEITPEHLPSEVWYEDEKDWNIRHYLDF